MRANKESPDPLFRGIENTHSDLDYAHRELNRGNEKGDHLFIANANNPQLPQLEGLLKLYSQPVLKKASGFV
jgi:hypothetical protein